MQPIELVDRECAARPVPRPSTDLLKIPLVRRFLSSRWYPAIFQWPTLIAFVLIIYQLMLGPRSAHEEWGW